MDMIDIIGEVDFGFSFEQNLTVICDLSRVYFTYNVYEKDIFRLLGN